MKKRSGISLYWKIQLVSWLLTSLYWGFSAFQTGNFIWGIGIADLLLDVAIGIGLTHAYRNFALRQGWPQLKLKALIPRLLLAVLLLSLLYMGLVILKLYLVRLLFEGGIPVPFLEFFQTKRLQLFITGSRLMSIWVLAYHLYHYSRREIETVRENARLSISVKEAQLNNLSAQLNPHFLFNSLNNIKFLVRENPDGARRAIDLLSELLRNSLTTNTAGLIPLADELALVEDYLELEAMRFEGRLQTEVLTQPEFAQHPIPPLCIQVLVENALKHGIAQSKNGGLVRIVVKMEGEFLKITVENPGELTGKSLDSGTGLHNLRERLALQYNGQAAFEIAARAGTVQAKLLIPSPWTASK